MRPHALNRGFTWSIPGGPYRVVTDDEAAQFDSAGFVVLRGVLSSDVLDAVEADLDEFDAATEAELRARREDEQSISEAGAITFTVHLVERSAAARALAVSDALVGVCRDVLGPAVSLYWDQAVYKKPEKPRHFPWHQDNGYTFIEPQQYLTCWVPLTDATIENGCPWVAPGVHRLGTLAHEMVPGLGLQCFASPGEEGFDEAVACEARRGDVVVFSSLTPHYTGPNTTDSVRKAYIVQYALTGSETLRDGGAVREPNNAPTRQFPVT